MEGASEGPSKQQRAHVRTAAATAAAVTAAATATTVAAAAGGECSLGEVVCWELDGVASSSPYCIDPVASPEASKALFLNDKPQP